MSKRLYVKEKFFMDIPGYIEIICKIHHFIGQLVSSRRDPEGSRPLQLR